MELAAIVKFVSALLFVLALMGGLVLVLRKFSGQPVAGMGRRRLKILEILPLDARRRAVLLRCDDREHLVILGPNSETVVESGIESRQDADVVPLKVGHGNE